MIIFENGTTNIIDELEVVVNTYLPSIERVR